MSSNSIRLYLSPELCIDIVGCESCDLPLLGNRTQVTCCHHQTNHTVPEGEQELVLGHVVKLFMNHVCLCLWDATNLLLA